MINEWSDAAIAAGIALMLQVFLGLLAFFLVAAVVKFIVERVDRSRPRRITRVEPRCERAGSQAEFTRRMRAGGAR
jgi:hypothetical protein